MDSTKNSAPPANLFSADFVVRLLLLASSTAALVLLATSKQTDRLTPPSPPYFISQSAQFNDSPALTYLFSALTAAISYSATTIVFSAAAVRKVSPSAKLLFSLLAFDAVMAGILAAATGAGGGVAYIGLFGNSYEGVTCRRRICNVYDVFCRHVGSAVGLSLLSSIALVLLTVLSGYSLYCRAL